MNRRIDDSTVLLADDPHWYKDAIIYELHVRAYRDSNGDGIGDFAGLCEKLDYLQDLGVTALWLLPFYPSPLRDDGYDIADYENINPAYGDMKDFKRFLKEAHDRGLRVITELVINHTSSDHPWFQRARRSPPGSKYRDYYVWSDTPERYKDARIIFKDFEHSNWTWDHVAKAYYWHRFYSHQPDLNFENPTVQKAVFKTLDHWMEMGVDGLRLDAVPYLYEREGTNCENLPETHAFLKKLRAHIDKKYANRMLLAEANQWPEDAASYFGDGDECHMNFHFPVMPRMFMAVQLENSFPILDILDQTPKIPESSQWAVFLRNHDELTLEMVTDEDRDYMYRMYAEDPAARINLGIRRRLAPLLKMRSKVELMNGLLMSLPGTPVLYYGDEIGMGDNIYLGDRDGVRTPMQWSPDRNAGFSSANPQKLYLPVIIDPEYHYESLNVEAQQNNPTSLLWWMKRMIASRKQHKVFGRGDIEFLHPDNHRVLAFIREHEGERILCVFNLSRFAQYVELDLKKHAGTAPVELFGMTEFPKIGELPYLLTLAPYAFYWFHLTAQPAAEIDAPSPVLETSGDWTSLLEGRARASLERILPRYVAGRRWFRSKARKIKAARITDTVPIPSDKPVASILVVDVEFVDGGTDRYVLPVAFATGDDANRIEEERYGMVIARLTVKRERREPVTGILHDAFASRGFLDALLATFARKKQLAGAKSTIEAAASKSLRTLRDAAMSDYEPRVLGVEQTNTSVVYGDKLILKMFRVLEEGESPDLEIGRFLTDRTHFPHTPDVVGSLSYVEDREGPATLGVLQQFVPNQGDAWQHTLDSLGRTFELVLSILNEQPEPPPAPGHVLDRASVAPPDVVHQLIGPYYSEARLLGERTAEMHLALASDPDDPVFAPEPFSTLYQRSLYQSGRTMLLQSFTTLKARVGSFPDETRELAREVLDRQGEIDKRLRSILRRKLEVVRVRPHGDYHLGQVLFTGKDFAIIDFEGEPARAIGERRFKRSPLRDVAGMLRSFHYATVAALRHGRLRPEDARTFEPWGEMWHRWVSAAFLGAWLERTRSEPFVPRDPEDLRTMLDFYLLDKCLYELGYELNNRPDWVAIPLHGLRELLGAGG